MRYSICSDMTQCTPEEVERLLHVVSPQRREKALQFHHIFGQYTSLKAYEMLHNLLQDEYPEWSGKELYFTYNQYGKPFLEGGPYFSISHTKSGIAVAISKCPIGIDIESIHPLNAGLVERTMSLSEQIEIKSSANPERCFTTLWTRKEALLKMRGTGIIDDLHAVLDASQSLSWTIISNPKLPFVVSIVE